MSKLQHNSCSCCDKVKLTGLYQAHPLLNVPICDDCYRIYNTGEFTIDDGNEIYCRWCGQGSGQLFLCDECPKSFCSGCIIKNFGAREVHRIQRLSGRWSCFLCSPDALTDYCRSHGWIPQPIARLQTYGQTFKLLADAQDGILRKKTKLELLPTRNVICYDVSRGRENIEIPVVNEVDRCPPPLDFVYVTNYIPGKDVSINNNPATIQCCQCLDGCTNVATCACLQLMEGPAYDNGILHVDKSVTGVYECNSRCSCHKSTCKNRVVGRGPTIKLEVFRCSEKGKGWGVRCRTDIMPGTYIADYLGELIPEKVADARGLNYSDEYLFNLDFFGCQRACNQLSELGIKRGLDAVDRQNDVDVSNLDETDVRDLLGDDFTNILVKYDAIKRAQSLGEKRITNHSSSQREGKSLRKTKSNSYERASSTQTSDRTESWYNITHAARLRSWRRARSILSDRVILETESIYSTYTIDAKSFGSVGRFFNHSCEPNMDKVTVFTDSHDPRRARVAFFASDKIPALTELCYDYGYQQGNVERKHRECLCGMPSCRKVWY